MITQLREIESEVQRCATPVDVNAVHREEYDPAMTRVTTALEEIDDRVSERPCRIVYTAI